MLVAIASENDAYDGQLYAHLAAAILAQPITKWVGSYNFSGYKSVAKTAAGFLGDAWNAGARHAILAVDNDGGSKTKPQHAPTCGPVTFNIDDKVGCRECWLGSAMPPSWAANGGKHCIVVPVQTIETWLLAIRGDQLSNATPEKNYDRPALKKAFFRQPALPIAAKVQLALTELTKPDALTILAQRPSFVRFRDQLTAW